MICKWCNRESSTDDFCEWCKRPLTQLRKVQSPGAADTRHRELRQVRKNDRLLMLSMVGVLILTFVVIGYTVLVRPPEADGILTEMNIPTGPRQHTNKGALPVGEGTPGPASEAATEGTNAETTPGSGPTPDATPSPAGASNPASGETAGPGSGTS